MFLAFVSFLAKVFIFCLLFRQPKYIILVLKLNNKGVRKMRLLVLVSCVAALGACSSAPSPTNVNGKNRQYVNNAQSAEVLALRNQLAESQSRLQLEQSRPVIDASLFEKAPAPSSTIFTVRFPYNGASLYVNYLDRAAMKPLLQNAKRIEVRGRTDGHTPSVADEKIAAQRAQAAESFLLSQGVKPGIISLNYVSAGDYVGDNSTAYGQSLNRRVDIEIFKN